MKSNGNRITVRFPLQTLRSIDKIRRSLGGAYSRQDIIRAAINSMLSQAGKVSR